MRPLYEITDALAMLLMASEDGELPPGTEEQLDALEGDLAMKVENCCCAVRNLEAEELALRTEAARFGKRAQVVANSVTRLKAYVKANLEKLGLTHLDAGLFKVRIQANGQPTITFTGDPAQLPAPFQRRRIELDNDAVRETVKAGLPLPDGVTCEKGSHLRIG